jgi:hypothetical protein
MRPRPRAWWPICAIAICSLVSTVADANKDEKKKKRQSIKECTTFEQVDREDEDAVDFKVSSACEMKIACDVRWSLTCAPGKKKAKKSRHAETFELEPAGSEMVSASAAECGFDGWEIADITWSCDPAP